jgi:hypothetical protein
MNNKIEIVSCMFKTNSIHKSARLTAWSFIAQFYRIIVAEMTTNILPSVSSIGIKTTGQW